MSTEANLEEEDDVASEPLSGSSSPLAEGPGGSGPQPQAQATPSGRPNIQQYLKANEGAGENLSQGIQQRYGQDADKFNKNLDETKSKFEAGSNPLNQKLGDEADNQIKTAFKDPSAILADQQQMQNFSKLRDSGYKSDIQGLGQQFAQQKVGLQGQLNQLGQQADLAKTEGGRFKLLQDTFGQPNYTRGQQKLDQLFLQTQPGVGQGLSKGLYEHRAAATQGLSAADQEAQAKLQALQGLSDQRGQQVKDALYKGTDVAGLDANISDRGLEDIGTSVNNDLAKAKALESRHPGMVERLKNNQLTTADVAALGLTSDFFANTNNDRNLTGIAGPSETYQKVTDQPSYGGTIYNTDLSSYLRQNAIDPTAAQVANPEEFARYRALQQLAGDTSGDVFGGATEAGGYNPYGFDSSKLQGDLVGARDSYMNNINSFSQGGDVAERYRQYFGPGVKYGNQAALLPTARTYEDFVEAHRAYNPYGGQSIIDQMLGGYGMFGTGEDARAYRDGHNTINTVNSLQGDRRLNVVDPGSELPSDFDIPDYWKTPSRGKV